MINQLYTMLDIEALQAINRDVMRGLIQLSIISANQKRKVLRHGKCVNNFFLLLLFFYCCQKRFRYIDFYLWK